jgi:adenylate cyclase
LLGEYYEALGSIISSHGGKIVNIAGDGMIAIWADPHIPNLQLAACLATLQSDKALNKPHAPEGRPQLPTRFGLYEGTFVAGRLSKDTAIENPIGDAINIASRIESANKMLKTNILASPAVVANVPNIIYRPVGSFLLRGVEQPTELMEIVGLQTEVSGATLKSHKRFIKGLKAFQQGHWHVAHDIFKALLATGNNDGPIQYYLAITKSCNEQPPNGWKGYIALDVDDNN